MKEKINELCSRIHIGRGVAHELLMLGGGDVDMVEACSKAAKGLDQCKALVINERFSRIEADLDEFFEEVEQ